MPPADDPHEAIAGLRWWHAIEVAPGVVTSGRWDLRPAALTLAGFAVEAVTPTFRDRYARVPGDPPPSPGTGARHAFGLRGLSVAVRARPVTFGGRLPAAPDADR